MDSHWQHRPPRSRPNTNTLDISWVFSTRVNFYKLIFLTKIQNWNLSCFVFCRSHSSSPGSDSCCLWTAFCSAAQLICLPLISFSHRLLLWHKEVLLPPPLVSLRLPVCTATVCGWWYSPLSVHVLISLLCVPPCEPLRSNPPAWTHLEPWHSFFSLFPCAFSVHEWASQFKQWHHTRLTAPVCVNTRVSSHTAREQG